MTFKDFKEIYAEESPIKLLNALIENVGYYADDMVAVAEAKHNRNEKDADYWRGEVRSMVERILWLRCKIERALKAQEPRVMTLEEVNNLDWDYCYLEEERIPGKEYRLVCGKHILTCVTWPSITAAKITYGCDGYGKRWRCWTSRPTNAQREETPWET